MRLRKLWGGRLWESVDNGASFTEVVTYYQGIYGYPDTAVINYIRLRIRVPSPAGTYSGSWFWRMTNPTSERLLVWENWEQLASVYTNEIYATVQITKLPSGNIAVVLTQTASTVIFGISASMATVQPKAITVDRSKGSASQATIILDNKDGIYSPDKLGDWNKVLWLNKEISVHLGYGSEQQKVFTGLIDEIQMSSYPAELTITSRDYSKRALDQQPQRVVDNVTYYALLFEQRHRGAIFTELATMAGWGADKIHADVTAVTIASIPIRPESIA